MSESKTNLTRCELDVLKWLALGKSDALIADLFGVSAQDVSVHVSNISSKIDGRNRVDISLKAIKMGLV